MNCASCGAELEPKSGAGRPSVYCSEPCRRMAEFQIRALVRRLDKAEIELRGIKAGEWCSQPERRIRALRRWIKKDTAKLRALLGGNNQI